MLEILSFVYFRRVVISGGCETQVFKQALMWHTGVHKSIKSGMEISAREVAQTGLMQCGASHLKGSNTHDDTRRLFAANPIRNKLVVLLLMIKEFERYG